MTLCVAYTVQQSAVELKIRNEQIESGSESFLFVLVFLVILLCFVWMRELLDYMTVSRTPV